MVSGGKFSFCKVLLLEFKILCYTVLVPHYFFEFITTLFSIILYYFYLYSKLLDIFFDFQVPVIFEGNTLFSLHSVDFSPNGQIAKGEGVLFF